MVLLISPLLHFQWSVHALMISTCFQCCIHYMNFNYTISEESSIFVISPQYKWSGVGFLTRHLNKERECSLSCSLYHLSVIFVLRCLWGNSGQTITSVISPQFKSSVNYLMIKPHVHWLDCDFSDQATTSVISSWLHWSVHVFINEQMILLKIHKRVYMGFEQNCIHRFDKWEPRPWL